MSTSSAQLPRSVIIAILVLCLLPTLLNMLGYSFATPLTTLEFKLEGPGEAAGDGIVVPNRSEMDPNTVKTLLSRREDALCRALQGEFVNVFLEWSAFCIALCTVTFAFTHYMIKRDVTTPIIGTALFFAGMIDGFRTLVSARLIGEITDFREFIPFTWALSRLFHVCILMIGTGVLVWRGKRHQGWNRQRGGLRFILLMGVLFAVVAYLLVLICALTPQLPVAMTSDYVIRRPFDAVSLVLYLFAGGIIFTRFQKMYPSIFANALLVSVFPNIMAQIHAAFFSTELFDNHYNISNYEKIIAYLVPLVGLILEYTRVYQAEVALRTTEEQFRVARGVQQALLPREAPQIPGYDLAGVSLPAEEVGGDYFDFVPMENDCLGIVVADVSGHDLGASIFMGQTRAYLRALARTHNSVPRLMRELNQFLMEDASDRRFVTLFFAKLDPEQRKLTLTAAGQNAFVISPSGIVSPLECVSMPLGIMADVRQEIETEWSLKPGEIFISLTDGIPEAVSLRGEFFGVKRVTEVVHALREEPAKMIVEKLLERVREFVGNGTMTDDWTIVILKG
ncbi:MAG: PP2C family protein-serine/threonine phosphatase [Planctomycetales bacterium]